MPFELSRTLMHAPPAAAPGRVATGLLTDDGESGLLSGIRGTGPPSPAAYACLLGLLVAAVASDWRLQLMADALCSTEPSIVDAVRKKVRGSGGWHGLGCVLPAATLAGGCLLA